MKVARYRTDRQLAVTVAASTVLTLLLWSAVGPLRGWLIGINIVAVAAYGLDKYAGRQGTSRITEATFYVLALLGGTPGSILSQQLFRHKTRKSKFRRVFWIIAAVQTGALTVWVLYR